MTGPERRNPSATAGQMRALAGSRPVDPGDVTATAAELWQDLCCRLPEDRYDYDRDDLGELAVTLTTSEITGLARRAIGRGVDLAAGVPAPDVDTLPDPDGDCAHCDAPKRLCSGLIERTGVPCCGDCAQYQTHGARLVPAAATTPTDEQAPSDWRLTNPAHAPFCDGSCDAGAVVCPNPDRRAVLARRTEETPDA